MAESINELTTDEVMEVLTESKSWGFSGARGISWQLIERESEKVTEGITDPDKKRASELVYIRMILDKLEANYQDEYQTHHTGEEPRYEAGPPSE